MTLKSAALKAEKKLTIQQGGMEPYMLLTGSNLNKNTLDLTLVNPVTFDVNTNSAWEIKSGDSWCTATVSAPRSNYVGKYTVSVKCHKNAGFLESFFAPCVETQQDKQQECKAPQCRTSVTKEG